ncbi:hypothetical protein PSTG_05944 [Puccinia striiformis f. sp. tritici PST-78]|uniref:Uncharacterized protein n=1 Tax=Puccinia striiformis f. sp. tritici PST-78 TaxID=1165861 RepID=A0A0L0VNG7_9BASI|nr:hypothetical protein PSTG_05944 [Puccinia striiformis f. sp. tritici PST-78]
MVVIIDDRGDAWEYSPNVVAVVPYNFFIGIGDINGAFLPPTQLLKPAPIEAELPPSSSSSSSSSSSATVVVPITDPQVAEVLIPMIMGQQVLYLNKTVPAPSTSLTSSPTTTPTITTEQISNEEEEIVQSNRSKLLAEQVLNQPLKQKQIALELEVAHQQQHKSIKSRKSRRKAGGEGGSRNGEGRSSSSPSVSSSSHLSKETDCDITPTSSLDPQGPVLQTQARAYWRLFFSSLILPKALCTMNFIISTTS